MTSTVTNNIKPAAIVALVITTAAIGIYISYADDPSLPGLGPAGIGFLLMLAAVLFGVRTARNHLPIRAGRIALAAGVLIAAVAAFLTHAVAIAAPLFAQPSDV